MDRMGFKLQFQNFSDFGTGFSFHSISIGKIIYHHRKSTFHQNILPELLHITRVHVPAGAGGVVEVLLEGLEALPAPVNGSKTSSGLLPLETAASSKAAPASISSSATKPSTTTASSVSISTATSPVAVPIPAIATVSITSVTRHPEQSNVKIRPIDGNKIIISDPVQHRSLPSGHPSLLAPMRCDPSHGASASTSGKQKPQPLCTLRHLDRWKPGW